MVIVHKRVLNDSKRYFNLSYRLPSPSSSVGRLYLFYSYRPWRANLASATLLSSQVCTDTSGLYGLLVRISQCFSTHGPRTHYQWHRSPLTVHRSSVPRLRHRHGHSPGRKVYCRDSQSPDIRSTTRIRSILTCKGSYCWSARCLCKVSKLLVCTAFYHLDLLDAHLIYALYRSFLLSTVIQKSRALGK